jgi:hypothetical protein
MILAALPEIKPFDPLTLMLIAALNPAVIAVAVFMGRAADQWQKLIVAAFAAALAGFCLLWGAAWLGLVRVNASGGEAAIFVMQLVLGFAWGAVGYWSGRRNG